MQEVKRHLKEATSDTWVIFDIDMVLVQPAEPAFQMANMRKHSEIAKRILLTVPENKRAIFLTLMTFYSPFVLIDTSTPLFIEELKRQNVPTLALTANLTGRLAHIPLLELWKKKELGSFGIDFTTTAPSTENIVFNHLPTYRDNYCLYNNGILFTNGDACSKGELLVNFLQRGIPLPNHIIFVDDRDDNILNVKDFLSVHYPKIRYTGIHYLAANDYPSVPIKEKDFEKKWEALALYTQLVN